MGGFDAVNAGDCKKRLEYEGIIRIKQHHAPKEPHRCSSNSTWRGSQQNLNHFTPKPWKIEQKLPKNRKNVQKSMKKCQKTVKNTKFLCFWWA
jgi:hypothetical protein